MKRRGKPKEKAKKENYDNQLPKYMNTSTLCICVRHAYYGVYNPVMVRTSTYCTVHVWYYAHISTDMPFPFRSNENGSNE